MPSWTEGYCHGCAHWSWDRNITLSSGKVTFPGHCSLYSCICAAAISNHHPVPPRYLPMEEVYEAPSFSKVS